MRTHNFIAAPRMSGRHDAVPHQLPQEQTMPTCKYCEGTEFFEGPSGGMSTNILCANPKCRHWFNYTPVVDSLDDLDRIEPSEEEKVEARRQAQIRGPEINIGGKMVTIESLYTEGGQLFRDGRPSRACFQQTPYGGYAAPHSDMVRMSGWLDAYTAWRDRNIGPPKVN